MSKCRENELFPACFIPDDGSEPINVIHVTVYDSLGKPMAAFYQDESGLVIDPTSYLGGGVLSLGECALSDESSVNTVDVSPNPDQTHVLVSGTGSVPAGLKTVTINNTSGTTTIAGGFQLGNGRRVDSISFDATELNRARGVLPAMTLAGGTWQWVGLEPIAEV